MLQILGFSRGLTKLRADLAIFDRSGQIAAVAEIKRQLGTSCDWAAQVRRNLLAHGIRRLAGYFLLITPDRLYLWKDAGTNPDKVPPTHEADMQPEFAIVVLANIQLAQQLVFTPNGRQVNCIE